MSARARRLLPNLALALSLVVTGTGLGVAWHLQGRAPAAVAAGSFAPPAVDATTAEPAAADESGSPVGAAAAVRGTARRIRCC